MDDERLKDMAAGWGVLYHDILARDRQELISFYDEACMDFDGVRLGTPEAIAAFVNGLDRFKFHLDEFDAFVDHVAQRIYASFGGQYGREEDVVLPYNFNHSFILQMTAQQGATLVFSVFRTEPDAMDEGQAAEEEEEEEEEEEDRSQFQALLEKVGLPDMEEGRTAPPAAALDA
ncbi:uncharacterized protein LOC120291128 [Eucalyptus grandis]|uniref:uncharacterized protein LOC120291128 n=1 Tax=Eucalyptus grandis TaxID=71139 RepID=UPI00192EE246|nr:uncharacterized protein LOC120291128 [Eucalyptus grandis]